MPEIPVQTMVSVSSEALLNTLDAAVGDGSISETFIVNHLSPHTLKVLLQAVVNFFTHKEILDEIDNPRLLLNVVKEHFDIRELLTDEEIKDIQDEREIDIDEILNDLDDNTLLDHIEQHRSLKEFIVALVASL